jgi:hypothetical protein
MKWIKSFRLFENLDNLIITDEEKKYIEEQIKDFDPEYYNNGKGFHIECDTFGNNPNPVTIECEKELDGIYLQFSQEAEDGYGGTKQIGDPSDDIDKGFTEFVKDLKTIEQSVSEIKKFLSLMSKESNVKDLLTKFRQSR